MPELPEVETVRRGLQPWLEGARINAVTLNRPNLRFPFPAGLKARLEGDTIATVGRRAKYLLLGMASGRTILSHLGMTGSWRFAEHGIDKAPRYYETLPVPKHDHLVLDIDHPDHGKSHLIYADPRRFGFLDLYDDLATSPYLTGLGPEPLGNEFHAQALVRAFAGKKTPIKAALLDQRVVAGLGNIYVAEGQVLGEAIEAGGSTLRDFRNAEGGNGYFQHNFAVYDREGAPCPTPGCTGTVQRTVQSGRSTFFCPVCQIDP
jgi:formamidopyrimidine-DNA glycosylase